MNESISNSAYSQEFALELVQRLGRIFSVLRQEAQISIADLSQETGVAASMITAFEHGEQDVDIDTLTKLLDGIKISMVDLFSNFERSNAAG